MMKTIALTTALALTGGSVLAQSSTGSGVPDANMNNGGGMNGPNNSDANARRDDDASGTTGMSQNRRSAREPSPGAESGAGEKKSDLEKPRGGDGADGR
jgi:hypothetical protein